MRGTILASDLSTAELSWAKSSVRTTYFDVMSNQPHYYWAPTSRSFFFWTMSRTPRGKVPSNYNWKASVAFECVMEIFSHRLHAWGRLVTPVPSATIDVCLIWFRTCMCLHVNMMQPARLVVFPHLDMKKQRWFQGDIDELTEAFCFMDHFVNQSVGDVELPSLSFDNFFLHFSHFYFDGFYLKNFQKGLRLN